jgi:hypothetical protein
MPAIARSPMRPVSPATTTRSAPLSSAADATRRTMPTLAVSGV